MGIDFQCEHCRKKVNAPDTAAGKRGKCPFCGRSSYIPAPISEDDLLPLAPLDEEEERRRQAELSNLYRQEEALLSETRAGEEFLPLEFREEIAARDLYHFVVNYCLAMADSNTELARTHSRQLRQFGAPGVQAVDDFISGTALEPALEAVPARLLSGFLKSLRKEIA